MYLRQKKKKKKKKVCLTNFFFFFFLKKIGLSNANVGILILKCFWPTFWGVSLFSWQLKKKGQKLGLACRTMRYAAKASPHTYVCEFMRQTVFFFFLGLGIIISNVLWHRSSNYSYHFMIPSITTMLKILFKILIRGLGKSSKINNTCISGVP